MDDLNGANPLPNPPPGGEGTNGAAAGSGYGPDDAFEVALLSGTGQTRSDAFLNLQADGTQNLANCVTCINNADGSRTYRVDLAGVPASVAANLSFDLIGFGQNPVLSPVEGAAVLRLGSHVDIDARSAINLPKSREYEGRPQ